MRNPSRVHIFIRKYFTCINVKILMIGIKKSVDVWKTNRHVTLKGIAHLQLKKWFMVYGLGQHMSYFLL